MTNNNNDQIDDANISNNGMVVDPTERSQQNVRAIGAIGSSIVEFLLGTETTSAIELGVYAPEGPENVGAGNVGVGNVGEMTMSGVHAVRLCVQVIVRRIQQWRGVGRAEGTLRERVENLV